MSRRRLTSEIAYDADLVIAMTEQHRAAVLNLAPAQLRHTFTLREAARLTEQSGATSLADLEAARPHFPAHYPEDISDPIGQDEQTFLTIGSEIADLLLPMLGRIRH